MLTDIRSREIFPCFASLPKSNSVDLDFYEMVESTYQPLRQWCFLGKIVGHTTIHHLELELTDIDNKKIPLHFYTDGRGSELVPAQVEQGHTVAVCTHNVAHLRMAILVFVMRIPKSSRYVQSLQSSFVQSYWRNSTSQRSSHSL